MQFLYPGFLWALLALAIPIIIHLFYFRRFKRVQFSNVRFLKEVKEETSARSRLRNLLVLLMRLLAVALLVLGFAQPFIPQTAEVKQGKKVVSVFVDNSFSMEAQTADVPLLEKAKQRATEIIRAYAVSNQFQILTHDFEGRHQRLVSQEDAIALVEEIRISPAVKSLNNVLERQKQLLNNSGEENKVAYLISDFQKNITTPLNNWQDSTLEVNLVPLQSVEERNISIDSVWFEAPVQTLSQSNSLLVKVKNWSDQSAENVRLSLDYNEQNKPLGSLSIPAKATVIDTVQMSVLKTGWQKAKLEITDFPVTFDDSYFFAFKVAERVNMLAIHEGNANRYLQAAFSNTDYFKLDQQESQTLNYNGFSDYQLIILSDLQNISSGLSFQLNEFVNKGGNVLVFPSANANLGTYNSFLASFPANDFQSFERQSRTVGSINTDEFIFNDVYENVNANLKLPVTQGNYRITQFGSRKQQTLLAFRDGNPYLVKYQVGKGNLYLCTAPLQEEFNDLVRNGAIFVPMVYKMAISAGKTPPLAYTIGSDEVIEANHTASETETAYKLAGIGEEFIPEQRIVGTTVFLSVNDQVRQAGFYELFLKANSALDQFAFNYDRSESELSYYPQAELKNLVGENINVIDASAKANFEQLIGERSQGVVLWRWCLILALIFLGLETLILRFWKG